MKCFTSASSRTPDYNIFIFFSDLVFERGERGASIADGGKDVDRGELGRKVKNEYKKKNYDDDDRLLRAVHIL